MTLPANVRRAIFDRIPPHRRVPKPGPSVEVVVRLQVDPARIRAIGGRERQLNLTARERTCLDPVRVTLFSSTDRNRTARLVINRRRANLLSVTESGILVFTYEKVW